MLDTAEEASAEQLNLRAQAVNMLCSLVVDRINVKQDGKTRQRPARVIVATEDHVSNEIVFASKYIHYPRCDIVHNDYAADYNGIDANTLSTQGERLSTVVDWARAATRSRLVIVCGTACMDAFLDDSTRVIDLQDFFFTTNEAGIHEPVSLARLAKKYFGYDAKRDPYMDAKLKISLFYVMKSIKICRIALPPFAESWFPKDVQNYKAASIVKRLKSTSLDDEGDDVPTPCNSPVTDRMSRHTTRESLERSPKQHLYENDVPEGRPRVRAESDGPPPPPLPPDEARPATAGRGKPNVACNMFLPFCFNKVSDAINKPAWKHCLCL